MTTKTRVLPALRGTQLHKDITSVNWAPRALPELLAGSWPLTHSCLCLLPPNSLQREVASKDMDLIFKCTRQRSHVVTARPDFPRLVITELQLNTTGRWPKILRLRVSSIPLGTQACSANSVTELQCRHGHRGDICH